MIFSIVISNFNYGEFLREAIDCCLAQTYSDLEIVVVDDGSTDNSREAILSYGDRIKPIFKHHSGQGSAYNAGFLAAKGDYILFLDADDILLPEACEEVVRAFAPGVVKVQFPLTIVDRDLTPLGGRLPSHKMVDGDVRQLVLKYGAYGSPPASGNCYRREVIEQVLPMPEDEWFIGADSYLQLHAPFYGNVITIRRSLGLYRQHRVHGKGQSGDFQMGVGNASGLDRVVRLVPPRRERLLQAAAKTHGVELDPNAQTKNPSISKNLLCALLLDRAPIGTPARYSLGLTGSYKCLSFPLYSIETRIGGALWFLVAGLGPRPLALRIVRYALDPTSRAKPPRLYS